MSVEDTPRECPLCMEPLEIDDMNFFPCTCGYQICRFCWHRIRTDENGLCPACRKQYPEDPAQFQPLTEDELQRIRRERRQKDLQRKQKAAENRKHLANVRVVQKNLVFVVGLSSRLGDPEVLKKYEYFGKFGKTVKVVINQSTSYAGAQGPSASAYVTYQRPEDALRAIQAVNNVYVDGRTLKASLGTTKYCSHFLRGTSCLKNDCMYLHELGEEAASFTKEDMQQGKHLEYEQLLYEHYMNTLNVANHNGVKSKNKNSCSLSEQSTTSLEKYDTSCEMSYLPDYGHNSSDAGEWPNLSVDIDASKSCSEPSVTPPTTTTTELPLHEPRLQIPHHARNFTNRVDVADLHECSSNSESFNTSCPSTVNLLQQQLNGKSHLDSMSLFSSNGFSRSFNSITISTNVTEERVETPEIPDTIPVSSSTDWQAAFGFTSGAIDHQEDDLGFDPVDESAKALADLLQRECNIPSTHTSGMKAVTTSANHGSLLIKPTASPPGFSSFHTTRTDRIGSKMMGFMDVSKDDLPQQSSLHNCYLHDQKQFLNKKDWQDGLRALLPNINISFGESPQESSCLSSTKQDNLESSAKHNNPKDSPKSDLWDPAIVTSWQGTSLISENCLPEEPPHWMASLHHLTEETHNHRMPILAHISDSTWPSQSQNVPPGFHQTPLAPQLPNVQKLAEGLP